MVNTPRKTFPELQALSAPVVDSDVLAVYRSPGPAKRTTASVLKTYAQTGLGTMATQNANAVAITGGSITGITDLAVTDGGTGSSTAADARTALAVVGTAALAATNGAGLVGYQTSGLTVDEALNESRSLVSFGLVPDDRSAGVATANVAAWAAAKAFMEAGGRVDHGPHEFAIDDYLSGPTPAPGTTFAYTTVPKVSAFYQRTDNREILRFNNTQSDPLDYSTRLVAERCFIGGFIARWANSQPVANTRAIAIAFRAGGNIPDGARDIIIGPGLELMNGRDGVVIHPDTVTSAFNFPVWGIQIHAPRFTSGASGTLIKLGNFGSTGGAPAISIYDPFCDCTSNLGSVPLMDFQAVSGLFVPNAEFGNSDGTTIKTTSCRNAFFVTPRWEFANLASNGKLVDVSGENSRIVFEAPELNRSTFTIGVGNDASWYSCFDGYIEIRNPIIDDLTVTSGRLVGMTPSRTGSGLQGRVKMTGQPAATGSAVTDPTKFRWGQNFGDGHLLFRAGAVQSLTFVMTLTASLGFVPVEPLRMVRAPQDGYLIGMKYEFVDATRTPIAVTAGSGVMTARVNGTGTPSGADSSFNSTTNSTGGDLAFLPNLGTFLSGDLLSPNIYTDGSLTISSPGSVVVTLYVAYY
jgi:hypothetical protein